MEYVSGTIEACVTKATPTRREQTMRRRRLHSNDEWKQRYRAPQILTSAVAWASPDRGIAATNLSGTYQLYCWDVPTGHLTQLTHRPPGIVQGILAPDGQFIYYFDDQHGKEIGHFVRVPYISRMTDTGRGEPEHGEAVSDSQHDTDSLQSTDITPELPLFSLPSSPGALAISRSGRRLALVAAHDDGFHLYVIDAQSDGSLRAPRSIWHSSRDVLSPVISWDGSIGVVSSDERTGKGHFGLCAFDLERGEPIAELSDGPESSLEPIAFSPLRGESRLLALTNRTGNESLLLWDPVSGERTDLAWPQLVGATRAFDWSPDGSCIVLRTLMEAKQRFYVYNVRTQTLSQLAHPSGTYRNAYYASTQEIFVHYSDATHPTQLVALDADTGAMRRTVLAAGIVPAGHPWRSITFASSDGQLIQGWLAVPGSRGPFPAIIEAHGGPFTVQTDTFSPSSQAWIDHGYAYLSINYRGSTTFGRTFQEQITGTPGSWEVEDLAAAREWLVGQRIADPARILLTGESYGGYLSLQALGAKPDLWVGGMARSAVTDWRQVYREASDAMRVGVAAFFGGTPDDKPEQYAASSPITSVAYVQKPILVIHGRNDSRTPARPMQEYAAKMEATGKQIEVHWYDTGHLGSLLQVEESIRHQELMLAFAERVCHHHPTRRDPKKRNRVSEFLHHVRTARTRRSGRPGEPHLFRRVQKNAPTMRQMLAESLPAPLPATALSIGSGQPRSAAWH
jgi:dipeptidyl aminopeptidase/acylaminoacyl peptidase